MASGVKNAKLTVKALNDKFNRNMARYFRLLDGIVKDIDTDNYTCKIDIQGDIALVQVPLQPFLTNPDNNSGIIIIPRLDSLVKVAFFDKIPTILKYMEIDKIIILDETNDTFIKYDIENKTINLKADKIYINDDSEGEPVVRGTENKSNLDKLYDHIDNLYSIVLTHIHSTPIGPSGPLLPPELNQIPVDRSQISTDKSNTSDTLSTKNFTE